jgi:hypothetical protein
MGSGGAKPPSIGEIDMPRLILAASLMAAFIFAACGASTPPPRKPAVVTPPSPAPSIPVDPSTEPTAPPVVTPAPTVRPSPEPEPTAKPTPRPTAPAFNRAERYLIDGIMRGEGDCSPVRAGALPGDAIAGIDCDLIGSSVARVGYYLFENEAELLDAYFARMRAEGIALESGGCWDGEGESAYIPWDEADGVAPYRHGCFLNDEGYANFRATLPGSHVYVGLLGRSADMSALYEWAYFGNQDTPSHPTLWQQSFVYRP